MNYNFNWTVIEKNIVPMLEGLGFGLLMAIIAITVGTIIGLLLAFAAVSKSKVPSFVITLALYSSAYMEEVFRAGLEAIPKGIIEAGQAIGLSGTVIKIEIELPIMMKKVLPSMGNYLISLFKDTSIASAITVGELTYISKVLTTQTFRVFEVWLTTGILYVAACYLIAFILRRVEKLFL